MDSMSNKSLRIVIVLLSLLLIFVTIQLGKEKQSLEPLKSELVKTKKSLDSLQVENYSLQDSIFPIQVELGRYQIAYEIFIQRNPKAASQYGDIISNETE